MNAYRLLADLVVVVHAAYVAFVVLGLIATLAGAVLGWRWVRNFWFRSVHLLMIAIVVVEALVGVKCPLTTWEASLRAAAGETVRSGSFIGRFVHDLLFFQTPPWVLTVVYCVFGGIVLATFLLAPPRWPRRRREGTARRRESTATIDS